MHFYKLFDAVKILKVIVNFINVPIPPLNSEQRLNNFVAETILDNLSGIAADNGIRRYRFYYDASDLYISKYSRVLSIRHCRLKFYIDLQADKIHVALPNLLN